MSYAPPLHIMLRRRTEAIDDADCAFMERALALQLNEVADAYGWRPPGVSFVSGEAFVGEGQAMGMDFMDDDGVPDAIAHHGYFAGLPWAIVGVRETTAWTVAASHEGVEAFGNLRLDQWAVGPAATTPEATRWPMELCDPVESDSYVISVDMFGARRDVEVSNYVLPAYWREGSAGPWDRMGILRGPFKIAPGGYAVVEKGGQLVEYGASVRHAHRVPQRPSSRAAQIKRGHNAGLRYSARVF